MTQLEFRKGIHRTYVYLHHGGSLSRAKNFAYYLKDLTTASIPTCWAIIRGTTTLTEIRDDINDLGLYAHVFLRDSGGKLYAVKIPAPDYDVVFNVDQEVKPEVGIAIAAQYSILAGETFIFEHGALGGKT